MLTDLCTDLFELGGTATGEEDVEAGLGELKREVPANASGRTSDHCRWKDESCASRPQCYTLLTGPSTLLGSKLLELFGESSRQRGGVVLGRVTEAYRDTGTRQVHQHASKAQCVAP